MYTDLDEILIGREILHFQIPYLTSLAPRCVIITEESLFSIYGAFLQKMFPRAHVLSFPGGEPHKTRETKARLEDQLLEKGFGRDTAIIAFGGGVVTDVVGFLASSYCRGVPLVFIPTSLLAMCDAAIGGKTGVNTPHGKNMIGSIYQPKKVLIDLSFLDSLPQNEIKNGISEMIKHALIADRAYFDYLEENLELLLLLDAEVVQKAIFESCRIKKEVVTRDEKEGGPRRLLNFGHTIAHALENVTDYTLAHGEAVAIGMLVESHISVQLGYLSRYSFDRIRKICGFHKFSRLTSVDRLLNAMVLDKKSQNGRCRFVMIHEIGSCLSVDGHYCLAVDEAVIRNALEWMNDALCCH